MHFYKKMLALLVLTFTLITSGFAVFADVIPGGETIGISLQQEYVKVTGNYDMQVNGEKINPETGDIQVGDYIIALNNQIVSSTDDLVSFINATIDPSKKTTEVTLTIQRNGKRSEKNLIVLYDQATSSFKTGLYVTDKVTGIGTITFYDTDSQTFGSLGHEIIDIQNQQVVDVSGGGVFQSSVTGISKSSPGSPGEKVAEIFMDKQFGEVVVNNEYGVYGYYQEIPKAADAIEVANQDEVQLGKAIILTVLDGEHVESFEIEITNVQKQKSQDIKGITFKITDQRLLEETGGIIQGMSGSPIIQNNKLVGAVTHVRVDQVDSGYGIFIEWMLEEANSM